MISTLDFDKLEFTDMYWAYFTKYLASLQFVPLPSAVVILHKVPSILQKYLRHPPEVQNGAAKFHSPNFNCTQLDTHALSIDVTMININETPQ